MNTESEAEINAESRGQLTDGCPMGSVTAYCPDACLLCLWNLV